MQQIVSITSTVLCTLNTLHTSHTHVHCTNAHMKHTHMHTPETMPPYGMTEEIPYDCCCEEGGAGRAGAMFSPPYGLTCEVNVCFCVCVHVCRCM